MQRVTFTTLAAVAAIVLSGLAPVAKANSTIKNGYSDRAIVKILEGEGFGAIRIVEKHVLEIKVDGHAYYMTVYDDGDLQLYFGLTGYSLSYKTINDWNLNNRLSRAYIDEEGDPVVEADLLANAGYSPQQLVEFVKVFDDVADVFRQFLRDNAEVKDVADE